MDVEKQNQRKRSWEVVLTILFGCLIPVVTAIASLSVTHSWPNAILAMKGELDSPWFSGVPYNPWKTILPVGFLVLLGLTLMSLLHLEGFRRIPFFRSRIRLSTLASIYLSLFGGVVLFVLTFYAGFLYSEFYDIRGIRTPNGIFVVPFILILLNTGLMIYLSVRHGDAGK